MFFYFVFLSASPSSIARKMVRTQVENSIGVLDPVLDVSWPYNVCEVITDRLGRAVGRTTCVLLTVERNYINNISTKDYTVSRLGLLFTPLHAGIFGILLPASEKKHSSRCFVDRELHALET